MNTPTHDLCILSDMSEDTDTVFLAGHQIPVKNLLQTKRLNAMLAVELGILCSATGISQDEALKTVIQVLIKQLAQRTPAKELSDFVGSIYSDYYEYAGEFPHRHLGRANIDLSFPESLELKVSASQYVLYNIVGKVLNDADTLDGFLSLLKDATIAYLMLTVPVSFQELSAVFGIPEEAPKESNIVQFGKATVDTSYNPFQAR